MGLKSMLISIAIPTWNRAQLLGQTLESLAAVRRAGDLQWEVLVCDNRSTDQTPVVINGFLGRLPLRRFYEPTPGKSHALNRLIREARGEWILFLDDDVTVDAGYLEGYLAAMQRYPQAVCLGGTIEARRDRRATRWQGFLQREYPWVFGILEVGQDQPMQAGGAAAFGGNMGLRRAALPVDPFDTQRGMFGAQRTAGEDVGIIQRLLAEDGSAARGWLVAGAKVYHYVPGSRGGLKWFFRWQMGIGRTWTFHRGRPAKGRWGQPWWLWRMILWRAVRTAALWRPWPTKAFLDRLANVAREIGWMRG